jgi:hypothetical protein
MSDAAMNVPPSAPAPGPGGGQPRPPSADVSLRDALGVGWAMLAYPVALVAGPVLVGWALVSWTDLPTWLVVLLALTVGVAGAGVLATLLIAPLIVMWGRRAPAGGCGDGACEGSR